ncbi:MAG: ATP-binding protein [Acidimicrobiales bacterium]
MSGFVGRQKELDTLASALGRVGNHMNDGTPGLCMFVRGRRRVGKSRLLEVFIDRAEVPHLFFTASQQGRRELTLFAEEAAASSLSNVQAFAGVTPKTWDGALTLLNAALPSDRVSVVVIDEFPYLTEGDPSIEGTFQKHWDRHLSKKPVLLLLVGSNLAAMESLNTPGRPLFERGTEMVVPPLNPREVAYIVESRTAAEAFDAYLITGGMPMLCDEWPTGATADEYLEAVLDESSSMFVTGALRSLDAEFPTEALARDILTQIGSGETTFSNIGRAAGGLQATSLNRGLEILTSRRIVVRNVPLSTKLSKEARYRVTDPYLQFWLKFVGPYLPEIDRGRGDRTLDRARVSFSSWRGRAIEAIVREALQRLLPINGIDAGVVGGFWTRTNMPEIDLIGADREPTARSVTFAGSIKWLDSSPLTQADFNQLVTDAQLVPGIDASTPLIAVSRTVVTAKGAALTLSAEDLLSAWT